MTREQAIKFILNQNRLLFKYAPDLNEAVEIIEPNQLALKALGVTDDEWDAGIDAVVADLINHVAPQSLLELGVFHG